MTVRVGINGFGRIGRLYLRAALDRPDVEVVAVNDLTSPEMNAHLLRYDSTQGRLGRAVSVDSGSMTVGDDRVAVLAERDPAELPWADLGVEVVIESSGHFTGRDAAAAHLDAGAQRVIISAPSTDADATFVDGGQRGHLRPGGAPSSSPTPRARPTASSRWSRSSTTPSASTPGLMTTVHAYTNDQNLLDLAHKDLRRARAAAINIVPTSTGAARATGARAARR